MGDDQKPPDGGDLIKFDKKRKIKKIVIKDESSKPASIDSGKSVRDAAIDRFRDSYFNPEKVDGSLPKHHQDNISRAQVIESLETVKDFISSGGTLDSEIKSKINDMLEDHSNRLKMFLIGISHVRVNNLTTLLQDIGNIEKELSTRNLEVLPTETLLQYFHTLSNREQTLLKYLQEISDKSLPGRLESVDSQEEAARVLSEAGAGDANVAARRNVRELLEKVSRELARKEKKVNRKLLPSGEEKTTKQ